MADSERRRELDVNHSVSAEVSQHVRSILGDAEAAATAIQHEAEQYAQTRREAVEEEAREIIANARRDADALVQQRLRRIDEISESLLTRAEGVVARVSQAEEVRGQLEELVASLGRSAQELARELGGGQAEPEPAKAAAEPEPSAPVDAVQEEDPVAEAAPAPPRLRALDGNGDGGGSDAAEAEPDSIDGEATEIADELLAARLVALQMAVAGGNRAEVEGHLRRAFDVAAPGPILDDVFGAGTSAETRIVPPEPARGDG